MFSNGMEGNVDIRVGAPGSPIDRRVLPEIQSVSETGRLSIRPGGGKEEGAERIRRGGTEEGRGGRQAGRRARMKKAEASREKTRLGKRQA